MRSFNDLKNLANSFFNRRESSGREMKRDFQWRRYLEWKNLTTEEKLAAKKFLLIPVFAYLIVVILNQNFSLIVLLLNSLFVKSLIICDSRFIPILSSPLDAL